MNTRFYDHLGPSLGWGYGIGGWDNYSKIERGMKVRDEVGDYVHLMYSFHLMEVSKVSACKSNTRSVLIKPVDLLFAIVFRVIIYARSLTYPLSKEFRTYLQGQYAKDIPTPLRTLQRDEGKLISLSTSSASNLVVISANAVASVSLAIADSNDFTFTFRRRESSKM